VNSISVSFALQRLRVFSKTDYRPKSKIERLTKMINQGANEFSPVYSAWFDKPVVLLVVIRQNHVPMPCSIVGESAARVRVRIQPGWEIDIPKELILAVEEVEFASHGVVN
jgi:hypothetical protein